MENTNTTTTDNKPVVKTGVIANMPLIVGVVGGIAGLVYANKKDCGFWGYVGYYVGGYVAGAGVGMVVKVVAPGNK